MYMIAFRFVYTLQPQLHKLYLFIFALDYFIFNLLYILLYVLFALLLDSIQRAWTKMVLSLVNMADTVSRNQIRKHLPL